MQFSQAPDSAGPAVVAVPVGEVMAVAHEYFDAGRLDAAERMAGHVLAMRPGEAVALHLCAQIAQRRGRLERAAGLLQAALEAGSANVAVLRDLADIHRQCGRPAEAVAVARLALAQDPGDPVSLFGAAMALYDNSEPEAAITAARAAIAQRPEMAAARMKLAQALLLTGQFAEGWEEYEWRYFIPGAASPLPEAGHPAWDGGPLAETLLLICDQGYGDCVQFARYLPWVLRRCPQAVMACSEELAPLMARIAPDLPVVTRWEAAPPFAAWCPLSGLPRLHGTRLESIPATPAYLAADPERVALWRARLDAALPAGVLRVGLAWSGRPTHPNDANRSVSLAALAPLADVPGVAFVAVQKGEGLGQIGQWPGPAPLLGLGGELGDFGDTAALIAALDLVVSVDTSAVHVAGAMGVPVWAMLPFAPDWRWLLGRADSPWYPALRLFRAPAPRDWAAVVAEVARALAEWSRPAVPVSQ